MTVLFAILTGVLIAALLYGRHGKKGVTAQGDPSQEDTAAWPGVVAGLAALGLIIAVVLTVMQTS